MQPLVSTLTAFSCLLSLQEDAEVRGSGCLWEETDGSNLLASSLSSSSAVKPGDKDSHELQEETDKSPVSWLKERSRQLLLHSCHCPPFSSSTSFTWSSFFGMYRNELFIVVVSSTFSTPLKTTLITAIIGILSIFSRWLHYHSFLNFLRRKERRPRSLFRDRIITYPLQQQLLKKRKKVKTYIKGWSSFDLRLKWVVVETTLFLLTWIAGTLSYITSSLSLTKEGKVSQFTSDEKEREHRVKHEERRKGIEGMREVDWHSLSFRLVSTATMSCCFLSFLFSYTVSQSSSLKFLPSSSFRLQEDEWRTRRGHWSPSTERMSIDKISSWFIDMSLEVTLLNNDHGCLLWLFVSRHFQGLILTSCDIDIWVSWLSLSVLVPTSKSYLYFPCCLGVNVKVVISTFRSFPVFLMSWISVLIYTLTIHSLQTTASCCWRILFPV